MWRAQSVSIFATYQCIVCQKLHTRAKWPSLTAMPRLSRPALLLPMLVIGLMLGWGAGAAVDYSAMARLRASAQAEVPLREALIASEIARFRLLPLALADDREVAAGITGGTAERQRLNRKLEALAHQTGAAVMYVIAPNGTAIAASNWRAPDSFVGISYRFRPYFQDALNKGSGEQFALGTVSHKPGLYMAHRAGAGVVVVKLEFDRIEAQWARAGGITFAGDAAGVILVSSRPEWRFAASTPLPPTAARAETDAFRIGQLAPPPFQPAGEGFVRLPGTAERWLMVSSADNAAGWRIHLAQPVDAAIATQVMAARIGAALLGWAGLALVWGWRGRARRRREHTAALESAVAARTADLSREIDERIAAEESAATLREGLRQANRLATLGQVTASIAHETAQPVAAIRTYASTAAQWLERGEPQQVRDNLAAISRLAERIGQVTAELRGFARRASDGIVALPLVETVEGARLLLKERLSRVDFACAPIPADLIVMASRVRLEQVLVNLLQNALDALEMAEAPRITLTLHPEAEQVRMVIADNGPGIAPEVAERIFTPFTTSRANGLGLGLVIAQDIMQDLGGALHLLPAEHGAAFEIVLRRPEAKP